MSKEHIIPNAIGGKLKSNELLCTSCNNKLGNTLDNVLAKQLNTFTNLLNIERDNGKPQKIVARLKDSNQKVYVHLDGSVVLANPKVNISEEDKNISLSVTAPNREVLNKIFDGFKEKYPHKKSEIEDLIRTNLTETINEEMIALDFNIGGDSLFFRAIGKIAANYFIFSGGAHGEIESLITYIKDDQCKNILVWPFEVEREVIETSSTEVRHNIVIVNNQEEKILFAIVELFSCFKYLVILNDQYVGSAPSLCYSLEILKREEMYPSVKNSHLTRANIEKIFSEEMRNREIQMKHIGKLFQKIGFHKKMNSVIEAAFKT